MQASSKPIGIFDSGIGGLTVWKTVREGLPYEDILYYGDSRYAPYGSKSPDEILKRARKCTEFLLAKNAKLIVVACNTATAAAIESLRAEYPVPFVGMEPAIKPASLMSKTGRIGVLATAGTFDGELFKRNQSKYGAYIQIYFVEGKGLVECAERGEFESDIARHLLEKYLGDMIRKGIDQLVLGCTHYPFFSNLIREMAPNDIEIVDPAPAIARRVKDLLIENRLLKPGMVKAEDRFFSNGNMELFATALKFVGVHEGNYVFTKLSR